MPDDRNLSTRVTNTACQQKILVIVNSFPVSGGSRIDKFVSLLPDFGFEPIVLSAKECFSPDRLELRQRYYPDTLKCFYAPSIGWSYFTERFLMRGTRSRHYRLLQLLSFPERSILMPDYMVRWIPQGIRMAKAIVKREGIKVVLTSSPFESTHLIGLNLKNSIGIPWVADFRDLWTEKSLSYRPATKLHDNWIRRLERKVFHTADFVIANTPENAARYQQRFKLSEEKLEVIPNGFDRNDMNTGYQPRLTPGIFRIGYAGALDKHDFPWRIALEALAMLAMTVGREKIRLVHCGYLSKQVIDYLQAHSLEDLVEVHGTLPHSDAITLTAATDIRLLLLYETAYSSSIVPMKLYNYLIMNGPILALAPETGVTASIISKTRMGCVISPQRGVETVYHKLLEYYHDWVNGCLSVNPDYAEVQRYDRHEQTGRLARILATVAESAKQKPHNASAHDE